MDEEPIIYRDARELFECARSAAIEMERTERQLAERDAQQVRWGISYTEGHGTNTDPNGMHSTLALVDFEAQAKRRIRRCERVLSVATACCYGRGGVGGIADVLGSVYADALMWRYLDARPWPVVAAKLFISESTARRYCATALETMDALGMDNIMHGSGIAEVDRA